MHVPLQQGCVAHTHRSSAAMGLPFKPTRCVTVPRPAPPAAVPPVAATQPTASHTPAVLTGHPPTRTAAAHPERTGCPREPQRRQLLLALLAGSTGGAAATWHTPAARAVLPSFGQPAAAAPGGLLEQLNGVAPVANPGVSFALRNRDRQLFYPPWLEGDWDVVASFSGASFPQGQRVMGRSVPGVLKGSIIVALPDVGAAMERPLHYRWRFTRSSEAEGGGVVSDRSAAAGREEAGCGARAFASSVLQTGLLAWCCKAMPGNRMLSPTPASPKHTHAHTHKSAHTRTHARPPHHQHTHARTHARPPHHTHTHTHMRARTHASHQAPTKDN